MVPSTGMAIVRCGLPGFSFRTTKQAVLTLFVLSCAVAAIAKPDVVLFPLGLAYLTFGVLRSAWLGLMDRPEEPPVALAGNGDVTPLNRERQERLQEPLE